ncbi:MAG: TolC family protein [Sphingomonadaceae bacterium]|nr:TolC family protein [Sphingomonadaceae bacterium]
MGETAQVGLVPQVDYIRQRTQLAAAQAALPTLVAEQHGAMHAVAILLARPPGDFTAELSAPQTVATQRPAVSPGIPSELLRRRPDIRAAERNLAAATADIGVAVADLYPRFSLTGMAELISTALGNLFTADSVQATASAALNFPILDFGRRRARIDERRTAADEAYLTYQNTVLGALRDVEDALARLTAERQRNAALRSGVADAERSEAAVRARYTTGLIGLTAVLEAQATVLSDRDLLAQSDGQLSRDTVALYKALGGGWDSAASH